MSTMAADPVLQDTLLVFVDVETTGFAPARGDGIVEVSLIA
jgi:DNA polymerase III epsilon subunit-like protein